MWIHTGHNSRPSEERWRQFFAQGHWSQYAFLREAPTRIEWYSVGSRGSPLVHSHMATVRDAVKIALNARTALDEGGVISPLCEALRVSTEEQCLSGAMNLLEELMPHFMTDEMGRTVTPAQFDRLQEWSDSQGTAARDARSFRQQFKLLSNSVTRALGCEFGRKSAEFAG